MTNLEYCNEILSIIGNVSEANDAIYNLAYDAYLKLGGQESQPTLATIYNELKQAIRIWDETGSLSITENGTYNLLGKSISVSVAGDGIPNDEIWYTTTDGKIVEPYYTTDLPTIVSNVYSDGKGIIKFSDIVTTIGGSNFRYCRTLTSITIPNSVITIQDNAFRNCSNLLLAFLGKGVTSLGKSAFETCPLIAIIIPNGVTTIQSTFNSCTPLASVTIGKGVTRITLSFVGCTNLNSLIYTGTMSQWNAINKGWLWNYTVPATVVHCSDGDVNI